MTGEYFVCLLVPFGAMKSRVYESPHSLVSVVKIHFTPLLAVCTQTLQSPINTNRVQPPGRYSYTTWVFRLKQGAMYSHSVHVLVLSEIPVCYPPSLFINYY